MLLTDIADHNVVFVGGKGGVGKTSISSGLALGRMLQGARVLLISTDPAHNLGHLWGRKLSDAVTQLLRPSDVTGQLASLHKRLGGGDVGLIDVVEINPTAMIAKHFDAIHRQMLRILPENMHGPAKRHLDSARNAPGSHEAAMLERVAENVELGTRDYDVVIFDTAPTGHTLHLLTLPEQLSTWTEELLKSRSRADHYSAVLGSIVGRRADDGERATDRDTHLRRTLIARQKKLAHLRETLQSGNAGFVVVTLGEPMPVREAIETVDELQRMNVALRSVVVNRRSPLDAGEFLAHRHALEAEQVAVLKKHVGGKVPIREVPLLAEPPQGAQGVALIAGAL
ncbi:ArsA family ATPase [Trueperella bialowiezensis]|uniref:Arsenical pump-driving ATPase n=1 Tax=Trueperella bialowiezensis TaxID=312285 RepID=A0A3S4Z5L6_9ACTO|nr:ArsA family ATPase [Trueperella bialowiezensis]VEI13480.1 Arsenical pump-driving ATPase [Trueperella bialowiezensis]